MQVSWENCEITDENFWENLRRCDQYNSLQNILMILPRYYKLDGNEDKSPKDLELELRSRNFNFGLIACSKEKDPSIKKAYEENKYTFIKPKYIFGKNKIDLTKLEPHHHATFYVIVSCRPRHFVIKEVLEHSSSIQENLNKLEEAGELTNKIVGNEDTLHKNDYILNDNEKTLSQLILEGKKLIKFEKVNFEETFKKAQEEYPNSEPKLYAMGKNGEPILALVNEGKIVCPIGICISMSANGKQIVTFVPLK